MKQLSILGCGWLGFPLAKSLLSDGFKVNGSTTTFEKLTVLKSSNIKPFQILLEDKKDSQSNLMQEEFDLFLKDSEILIINIPPKLRGDYKENFVQKIHNCIPNIEKSSVKKVIFISSTSVYSDKNRVVTENSIAVPETESGKQLLETEKLLLENSNFETTIIRFGGLIGEDRNPIKFLSGRKNIENPYAPINLIHQKDCIGMIKTVIKLNCWGELFNGVAPYHPSRKEYYIQKAIDQNLPLPEFDYSKPSMGKTILSDKVQTILKYKFKIIP
ncbi:MAG: NAD(P)H-binding protein [Flavobacterium sp.]|nr:NAD(P)H-binding protein [Flavobacterium sp.]